TKYWPNLKLSSAEGLCKIIESGAACLRDQLAHCLDEHELIHGGHFLKFELAHHTAPLSSVAHSSASCAAGLSSGAKWTSTNASPRRTVTCLAPAFIAPRTMSWISFCRTRAFLPLIPSPAVLHPIRHHVSVFGNVFPCSETSQNRVVKVSKICG